MVVCPIFSIIIVLFFSFCIVSTTWSDGPVLALNFTHSRRNPRRKSLKLEEVEHTGTLFENCHKSYSGKENKNAVLHGPV